MNKLQLPTLFACLGLSMVMLGPAYAKDVPGSRDHPVVSRYQGSSIVGYQVKQFDEYGLVTGKVARAGVVPQGSPRLEGKVTRISYETPKGRTTLEVFRNYQMELKKAGFEMLFTCRNRECGGRAFNHTVVPYWSGFSENYEDQRYLAGKLARPQGDLYVVVYVVRNYSEGGPRHNRLYTQLDVIEVKAMQAGMVKVDANAMAQAIAKSGRVALYGIYFDTNKALIKPESRPTLDEIAKLLKKNTALKLVIVGHTDNRGAFDYNMDLSKRRAKAVANALVEHHGVSRARLKHWGVGYLSPIASNQTEQGRGKNRRVELVGQ